MSYYSVQWDCYIFLSIARSPEATEVNIASGHAN